ncbi:hypothetical protein [Ruegeria sp.]|uniref:hypothetical protein n=1 Tax=Ruegeria sp. TaxID=1879320 RepID=UPI003AFFFBEC
MADAAFNTIAEVQRLRDAGFEQAQAEAITLSIHAGVTGGVATRADLTAVEKDLKAGLQQVDRKIDAVRQTLEAKMETTEQKIEAAEQRLEAKIERARFDLSWRLLGGVALLNGALFAALRYMPPAG